MPIKKMMLCGAKEEDGVPLQQPSANLDLQFHDISLSIRPWKFRQPKKTILHGINGRFKAGELTAIMGPSGAGKSSLLNVISGFRSRGVTGTLLVNGHPRNERIFQKMSCFIAQEDALQPMLTVTETMMVAASLKLPSHVTPQEKQTTVSEILASLGLTKAKDTQTTKLSGGQQKRLSIALELINNPPVFFLDEPTSGLDNVAAKQCLSVLKMLASQGRTIVCTIHQPSALLLSFFDSMYVVAQGICIYQGSTRALIPFLKSVGIHCPTHYNPSDYILEMSEDKSIVQAMSENIMNGHHSWTNNGIEEVSEMSTKDILLPEVEVPSIQADANSESGSSEPCITDGLSMLGYRKFQRKRFGVASSGWMQFCILLKRMILQIFRNRIALRLQLIHHVFCGFFIGCIFFNQANDGSKMFNHMKFCIGVVLFHGYTWIMVPVLCFPYEVKLLRREHFNKWYSLVPYYSAMTVSKIPTQVFFSMIFITMVYFMSGLPMDLTRFASFAIVGILVSIASEGLGLAIASAADVTTGSVAAPAIIAPFLGLAVYGFDFANQISWLMNAIMKMSFLRCGVVALVLVVFGFDRKHLNCDEIYCHYKDPQVILRMLDIQNVSLLSPIIALFGLLVLFRTICFIGLRWRLAT
ncbi:hypothetical protein R5R35_010070 [Gryllus longicercus]|uniref:ABC transporter domain-containing protein n=1 Tax=Gryllus longicercus TaxID=2509291 RepID=A0AAN9Z1Z1_9ORTH